MSQFFQFRLNYFLWMILLLIIEISIARFVDDAVVRPYIGDLLVVILLYCFLRSLFLLSIWKAALLTLIFSFLVEALQYFHVVDRLGLQDSRLAKIVIGNTFAWVDLVMYSAGISLVLFLENFLTIKSKNSHASHPSGHNV